MTDEPEIRALEPTEDALWLELRKSLWPDVDDAMHRHEMRLHREKGDEAAVLVAIDGGEPVAFAELTVRPRVEGSFSERVAYLEGWYVAPEWRGRGLGRRLVAAGETWAQRRGLTEIASDTEIDNMASIRAHESLGFRETFRTVGFLKEIRPDGAD